MQGELIVTWRLTVTMPIMTDAGFGYGFNITDELGGPVVSFMYKTRDDAKNAAVNALSLIQNAISVQGYQASSR
jgi:hypothetical protein